MKDGEKLNIIYHCYGGTHSSVTAAAVHLGWLPSGRTPTIEQMLQIPYFETRDAKDHGYITYMGTDENNNHIYTVGRRDKPHVLVNIVDELAAVFNIPQETFRFISVMPNVNIYMRIGGVLSRKLKLASLGRPIVTMGTLKALPNIQKLVAGVKKDWEINK